MEFKKCSKCFVDKPISDFYFRYKKTIRENRCKKCQIMCRTTSRRLALGIKIRESACPHCGKKFTTWHREKKYCSRRCLKLVGRISRVHRMKHKAISVLGSMCKHCGNKDPEVLQFDHINPLRKISGLRIRDRSKFYSGLIKGNTDNIQLLCANCHMKKTNRESQRLFLNTD